MSDPTINMFEDNYKEWLGDFLFEGQICYLQFPMQSLVFFPGNIFLQKVRKIVEWMDPLLETRKAYGGFCFSFIELHPDR